MAAVGGRTALSVRAGRAGRFELALRSDARLTNTAVDAVAGLVGATERTRLVRMMLEGAGVVPLALGGGLTPTVEAGLRYDTGDAETGAGLEVGGGLGYAARRLSVTVNARGRARVRAAHWAPSAAAGRRCPLRRAGHRPRRAPPCPPSV